MNDTKQYYLVTQTTCFVDPHGDTDDGEVTKTITSGKEADRFYKE